MANGKPEYASPQEAEIARILKQAKEEITKLEADIKKLSERGTAQLEYNPPGYKNNDNPQTHKEIKSIETNILTLKKEAIQNTDKIAESLPEERRWTAKAAVRNELFPDPPGYKKDIVQNKALAEKDSIRDAFMESRRQSRFLNKGMGEKEKD